MILIAYDESEDGQSAIDVAGGLLGAERAKVLSVWERFIDVVACTGGVGPGVIGFEALDNAYEESARERAGRTGLNAEAHTRARQATILAEDQEAGARATVLGTRGLTGVKSVLLGSVTDAVLQRAGRQVFVVASSQVVHDRATRRR